MGDMCFLCFLSFVIIFELGNALFFVRFFYSNICINTVNTNQTKELENQRARHSGGDHIYTYVRGFSSHSRVNLFWRRQLVLCWRFTSTLEGPPVLFCTFTFEWGFGILLDSQRMAALRTSSDVVRLSWSTEESPCWPPWVILLLSDSSELNASSSAEHKNARQLQLCFTEHDVYSRTWRSRTWYNTTQSGIWSGLDVGYTRFND